MDELTPRQRAELQQRRLSAQQRLEMMRFRPQPRPSGLAGDSTPNTGLAGQAASGYNTGFSQMVGLPVDAATAVLEGMAQRGQEYRTTGVNPETGEPNPIVRDEEYQRPEIATPVGGSQFNVDAMDPFIADDAPDTTAERYLFSIGRDLGASTPFAPFGLMSGAPRTYAATELASSVGSGSAEQLAENLGGNEAIQTGAALVGGLGAPALAYSMLPRATGETVESLSARRDADYAAVRGSTATVPQAARNDLMASLRADLGTRFDEVLHPRAARVLTRAETFPATPSLSEIDELRRFVRDNVAGSPDTSEARIGQRMVEALDNWLRRAADSGQLGPDAQDAVERLLSGRDAAARLFRAEDIVGETGALERATRRAATSGTGGNEINTIRQNIRAILDNDDLRRGYTNDEIAQMERIVRGSTTENVARMAGRFAPSSGFLPFAGNVGAVSAGVGMGGPLGTALALTPAALGFAGKELGENLTRRNVDILTEIILNGRPLPSRSVTPQQAAIVRALIASPAGAAAPETEIAP